MAGRDLLLGWLLLNWLLVLLMLRVLHRVLSRIINAWSEVLGDFFKTFFWVEMSGPHTQNEREKNYNFILAEV